MIKQHHITLSRMVGGVVFAMFLVLTPRAWVDAQNAPAQDQIPVEALENNSECLWCEVPKDCKDDGSESVAEQPMWLDPDQPVTPSPAQPCQKAPRGTSPGA